MNILKGKIKYTAGKVFEGQFGPSINCAVTLSTGEDIRVYGKPDDEKLKALRKDDEVTIIHDGKSYKIAFDMITADNLPAPEENKGETPAAQPQRNGKLNADEILEKATFMTDIYTSVYHQMLASGLEPLQAQPAAATVFIQIGKFF